MKKPWITLLKLLAMAAILAFVGFKLKSAWGEVSGAPIHVNAAYAAVGIVCFALNMITSALVWRFLAYRIGDRSPTVPLVAAYLFSQMGKYAPGKVMLLFMRMDRAKRFGMSAHVCVVATLIENAMYMVSGGVVAVVTMLLFVRDKPLYVVGVLVGMLMLLTAAHPAIFYRIVNVALRKMKQPEVPGEQRLSLADLLASVVLFLPCWLFGGLSLWAATAAITPFPLASAASLPGAYALGVTGGMASLLPGGLGTNDGIKSLFLLPLLANNAKIALLAVAMQRLFQILVEIILGVSSGSFTSIASRRVRPSATAASAESLSVSPPAANAS